MLSWNTIVVACLVYVTALFAIAFWAEQRARAGRLSWLRSPLVYTLSISVYCTAWTYYGAVGSAARGGVEFIAIYLGPTITFIGWWFLLRKLVRIARDYARRLWVRVVFMGVLAIIALGLAQIAGFLLPDALKGYVSGNAADRLLGIIANAMLAVVTFSLTVMVTVSVTVPPLPSSAT